MDVAAGLAALVHELMDQRQDRVADVVGLLPQGLEIQRPGVGMQRYGLGGLGGDDAAACLGPGQRDLDFDVAGQQRVVAPDGAHGGGAEGVAEQQGVEHGGRGGRIVVWHGGS